jgi:beta-mannosidase
MNVRDLSAGWQLRQEELHCDAGCHVTVAGRADGWLAVSSLPCDVHVPLIQAGIIAEPLEADNCFKCEWIERKSWWFRKVFRAEAEQPRAQACELVLEGLDVHADVFLNGAHLGHHRSAMYPFRQDVREVLKEGDNVLLVRVTSGLETVTDLDVARIKDTISSEHKRGRGPRGDDRRVMVRKPQYVYGWDWNPRVATCGIMGAARIEAYEDVAIRGVRFATEHLVANSARVSVEVEVDNVLPISTLDVVVRVEVSFQGAVVAAAQREVFVRSGLNHVPFALDIANPALWWPNGMGEQPLYAVRATARSAKGGSASHEFTTGIRTVQLNTDKVGSQGRLFRLEVNGVGVFCKGGNWETPDSIYGRIPAATYETLVREAREANFTCFRVNGCDAYEPDSFYTYCDRYGILVWQDFGFSCAGYPDELEWFRHEVEQEVDYQTRRLRNHPCLALWCGNNESQHLLRAPDGKKLPSPRGARLYNYLMPEVLRQNCPDIPYWNSSPYGGELDMESDDYGDKHYWVFMSNDAAERISPEAYDKVACKFVSEFGCIGPGKLASIRRYLGTENVEVGGKLWQMHTNPFNTYFYSVNRLVPQHDALSAGIDKFYAEAQGLSLEEVLLFGGLFQGMMLGYAYESMRCATHNSGALVWSYNDAWGEIGWSIIDHYLTRKISFPFVRRALAHQKLVLRQGDAGTRLVCLNDTPEELRLDLEYGYQSFTGEKADTGRRAVTVAPFSTSSLVLPLEQGKHDPRDGVYYAAAENLPTLLPAILCRAERRDLRLPEPTLSVADVQRNAGGLSFSVSSDTYAHAVHFGLADEVRLSDEYFDLLPGEVRQITVAAGPGQVNPADIRPRAVLPRRRA